MASIPPPAKSQGFFHFCNRIVIFVTAVVTLDDKGIPETADGRIEIAKRIIDRAAQYGIDKSDIIIDPLTMTISTMMPENCLTIHRKS